MRNKGATLVLLVCLAMAAVAQDVKQSSTGPNSPNINAPGGVVVTADANANTNGVVKVGPEAVGQAITQTDKDGNAVAPKSAAILEKEAADVARAADLKAQADTKAKDEAAGKPKVSKDPKPIKHVEEQEDLSRLMITLQEKLLKTQQAQTQVQQFLTPFLAAQQKAANELNAKIIELQKKYDAEGCDIGTDKKWIKSETCTPKEK